MVYWLFTNPQKLYEEMSLVALVSPLSFHHGLLEWILATDNGATRI
jgi:hypothetical protein